MVGINTFRGKSHSEEDWRTSLYGSPKASVAQSRIGGDSSWVVVAEPVDDSGKCCFAALPSRSLAWTALPLRSLAWAALRSASIPSARRSRGRAL
jgi:hypothetical protein